MLSIEELQPNPSSIHCLYCPNTLPANNKEHIFNAAWGGSHKTGKLICDDCNTYFGEKMDSSFSIYTDAIMNATGVKGQRHESVPTIKLGNNLILKEGGILDIKDDFIIEEIDSETAKVSFKSKSLAKKHLRGEIKETIFDRKYSEAEIKEILETSPKIPLDQKIPIITKKIELKNQYRSTAHTLLKLLKLYQAKLFDSSNLQNILKFVREDRESWLDFAIKEINGGLISEIGKIKPRLDNLYNCAEIYCSTKHQKILGTLTILGEIKRHILLGEYTGRENKYLIFTEDILKTSKPPRGMILNLDNNQVIEEILDLNYALFKDINTEQETTKYFQKEINHITQERYLILSTIHNMVKEISKSSTNNTVTGRIKLDSLKNILVRFLCNLHQTKDSRAENVILEVLSKYQHADIELTSIPEIFDEIEKQLRIVP